MCEERREAYTWRGQSRGVRQSMKVDAKMEVGRGNQNKTEDAKTVTSLGKEWEGKCEVAQNWTIFV